MNSHEIPWNNYHHRSSFLPNLDKIENDFSTMLSPKIIDSPKWPILVFQAESQRNFGNISTMISIGISVKIEIIENIHIGASRSFEEIHTYKALFQAFRSIFAWSHEELSIVDPNIVFA